MEHMQANEAFSMLEDLRRRMMEMVESIEDKRDRQIAREAMEQALADKCINMEVEAMKRLNERTDRAGELLRASK